MVVAAVLERVPAVVDRVQREITLARFIGKLAVDQGVRELRDRVESLTAPAPSSNPSPPTRPEPPLEPIDERAAAGHGTPDADELALVDYDELPASNIVAKLAALEPGEREQIAAYERAGRNRRTVLGKIAQLGDEPATS